MAVAVAVAAAVAAVQVDDGEYVCERPQTANCDHQHLICVNVILVHLLFVPVRVRVCYASTLQVLYS